MRSKKREVLGPNAVQTVYTRNRQEKTVIITFFTETSKPQVLPVSIERFIERLKESGDCDVTHLVMKREPLCIGKTTDDKNVLFLAKIPLDRHWKKTFRAMRRKARCANLEVIPHDCVKKERDKYTPKRRAGRSRFSRKPAPAAAR